MCLSSLCVLQLLAQRLAPRVDQQARPVNKGQRLPSESVSFLLLQNCLLTSPFEDIFKQCLRTIIEGTRRSEFRLLDRTLCFPGRS